MKNKQRASGFQKGNKQGATGRRGTTYGRPMKYQCVYCKFGTHEYSKLSAHEAVCPMRYTKRTEWAGDIARAKRKEAKRGNEKG